MTTQKRNKIRLIGVADILLIALLAAIAAAAYFVPRMNKNPAVAVITVDGEEYTRTELAGIDGESVLSVNGVEIKLTPDGARVTGSDCPDKTCVRTGEISSPGEAAVCAPNKVVVYIEGKDADVDGLAY